MCGPVFPDAGYVVGPKYDQAQLPSIASRGGLPHSRGGVTGATPDAFAMFDPVQFVLRGAGSATTTGHVARKLRQTAVVVTLDGGEFRVPWALLAPWPAGGRRRVATRNDRLKAHFRVADEIQFEHGSTVRAGMIARLGPSRAYVVCDDGQEFRVPYARLQRAPDAGERDDERRLATVARCAEQLMAAHGLAGWSLQLDDASRRAGSCNAALKVIGLSRLYCLHATAEELRETVLHEIAHALVGTEHGHDRLWKAAARAIGCTGNRCHHLDFAPPRYLVSCFRCGWTERANTRRRRAVCRACRTPVTYRTFTRQAWEEVRRQPVGRPS